MEAVAGEDPPRGLRVPLPDALGTQQDLVTSLEVAHPDRIHRFRLLHTPHPKLRVHLLITTKIPREGGMALTESLCRRLQSQRPVMVTSHLDTRDPQLHQATPLLPAEYHLAALHP